jgi:Zn-dependent M28 family amino/carboxypeptidase
VQRGEPAELAVDVRTSFHDDELRGFNVIAEIPGVDPGIGDELVMLGAHFDSWHPGTGATDNGSSSAVVMEAMRLLKAVGAKPRRTIRMALWTGEEQGLLGSKGYVTGHFADRETMELRPEHERLAAYFNLDNGGGKIRGVYCQGNLAVQPVFEAWLAPFHDLGATTLTARGTGGTDHLSFERVGLPGFQFIQDPMDYGSRSHHTNMDLYERVHPADVKQAATILAAFAWHAAQRDAKLPRKPLPAPGAPREERPAEPERASEPAPAPAAAPEAAAQGAAAPAADGGAPGGKP